jgi:hypothetical protein
MWNSNKLQYVIRKLKYLQTYLENKQGEPQARRISATHIHNLQIYIF